MLFDHLLHSHRAQSGHNGYLLHHLLRFLLAQCPALDTPLPCQWCGTTSKDYTLLDDSVWAQLTHRRATVLNVGCALTWLRPDPNDGRSDAYPRRRSGEPSGPGILKYARVTGRAGVGATSGQTETKGHSVSSACSTETKSDLHTEGNQLVSFNQGRRPSTDQQAVLIAGPTPDSTRGSAELGIYARLVCPLLPTGELRSRPIDDEISRTMARPSTKSGYDALALPPHPSGPSAAGESLSKAQDTDPGRDNEESCHSEHGDHGGSQLSIPLLELPTKEIDDCSNHPHCMDHDGIAPWSSATGLPGAKQLHQVLCHGSSEQQRRSDTVEVRNDSLANLMKQLAGSSLWHLVGARMRQPSAITDCPGHQYNASPTRGQTMKLQWIAKLRTSSGPLGPMLSPSWALCWVILGICVGSSSGSFCAVYVDTGPSSKRCRLRMSARRALPTPPLENLLSLHFVPNFPPQNFLIYHPTQNPVKHSVFCTSHAGSTVKHRGRRSNPLGRGGSAAGGGSS